MKVINYNTLWDLQYFSLMIKFANLYPFHLTTKEHKGYHKGTQRNLILSLWAPLRNT